jgi:hypothetical protein
MKGVNKSGIETESRRVDAPEAGGVLSGLDVPSLRRFAIDVMRRGGVPIDRICRAMRTSKSSLFRDAQPPKP